MWPFNLSVRLLIVDLVGRYLTNYLIRREPIFQRIAPLIAKRCRSAMLCGISSRFQLLSPSERQVAHVLLTRPPLIMRASSQSPLDLHVLGVPPAFVLSQDQTLYKVCIYQFLLRNLIFLVHYDCSQLPVLVLKLDSFMNLNLQGFFFLSIVQFSRYLFALS